MDISDLFNPGLYLITCLKNGKVYIGESSNILSRLGRHVDNLENNRHDCLELQNDFNHFGKKYFKFESLETNKKYSNQLLRKEKEQQYINNFTLLYNSQQNKNWNFYSQKLQIKNIIYNSLRQAAISTGESRTNINRKCRDIKNTDYIFLEKSNHIYKKRSISCKIDGIIYSSISEASTVLKQSPNTIRVRCKSEKYPNYILLNK